MEGMANLIHWGSSVTVSPGVTTDLVECFGRLEGGAISTSPSESTSSESDPSLAKRGAGGAAAVMVKVMLYAVSSQLVDSDWLKRVNSNGDKAGFRYDCGVAWAYSFSPPFMPNPLLSRPRTGLLEYFNKTILPTKLLF